VVDNFSRGVTQRLKIDHKALSAINPRIITCSITGFGETGPDPDRSAFDLVTQAMGGGMSITGEEGGRPIRSGIPIGDLGGGLFGALGVLSALHARSRTGRGQHVDISMLDSQISMLNYMATMYFLTGDNPAPVGNSHFVHVPYGTFRTRTSDIVIAVLSDAEWRRFLEIPAFGRLKVYDLGSQPERFANRALLNREIERILVDHDCDHWIKVFRANRIPSAPVNDFGRALSDPQVRARDMIVTVAHPNGRRVEMPGNPIKLSDTMCDVFSSPPLLGQHTDEVLATRLALSADDICELKRDKIVG
jgi:crotonobetainyl-CoA:carnitine CoA-transferase CaiB-like acyl-CoA transferase